MTPTHRARQHVVDRCPSCGVEHDVRVHACEACDTPLRPWCRAHSREIGWLDGPACRRCAQEAVRRTRQPRPHPAAAPARPAARIRPPRKKPPRRRKRPRPPRAPRAPRSRLRTDSADHVLVVEDDPRIAREISRELRRRLLLLPLTAVVLILFLGLVQLIVYLIFR